MPAPRSITILADIPWGVTYHVLEIEVLVHLWLAGVFTYLLAYDITRRRPAALLAAVAFALGGYFTSYPLLQVAVLETLTWLPLVLFMLRRAVLAPGADQLEAPRRTRRWLLGAGLVLALAELAGHPQTFMHLSYLVVAYYLYLTIRARWPWRRVIGHGLMILAVFVGVAGVSLLPGLRYMGYSVRGQATYDFVSSGLPLEDYLQLLFPTTFSQWIVEYGGIGTLFLAVFAWRLRKQEKGGEIGFWLVAALLAAWLALGDQGVLFQAAYYILPGFSLFRQQERLVSLFAFALAMLASQGMALWLKTEVSLRRRTLRWVAIVLAGVFLGSAACLWLAPGLAATDWPSVALRQAGILLLVVLLLWGRRGLRWRAVALVLLLAADLFINSYTSVGRAAGSSDIYWPQPSWLTTVQEDEPTRID